MSMKTSDKGIDFIANEEGFVPHIYKCQAGVDTIGYGHAKKPGETFGTITKDEAKALLRVDVGIAEANVLKNVKVVLNQNQFDSLVSFTFNLGGGALASSTLLKLLNKGDYNGAANEFPKWCKAAGKVNAVLERRRKREMAMFLLPVPAQAPAAEMKPEAAPAPVVQTKPIDLKNLPTPAQVTLDPPNLPDFPEDPVPVKEPEQAIIVAPIKQPETSQGLLAWLFQLLLAFFGGKK